MNDIIVVILLVVVFYLCVILSNMIMVRGPFIAYKWYEIKTSTLKSRYLNEKVTGVHDDKG